MLIARKDQSLETYIQGSIQVSPETRIMIISIKVPLLLFYAVNVLALHIQNGKSVEKLVTSNKKGSIEVKVDVYEGIQKISEECSDEEFSKFFVKFLFFLELTDL